MPLGLRLSSNIWQMSWEVLRFWPANKLTLNSHNFKIVMDKQNYSKLIKITVLKTWPTITTSTLRTSRVFLCFLRWIRILTKRRVIIIRCWKIKKASLFQDSQIWLRKLLLTMPTKNTVSWVHKSKSVKRRWLMTSLKTSGLKLSKFLNWWLEISKWTHPPITRVESK